MTIDLLQTKKLRRAVEEAAEPGDRGYAESLGRRRQIADRHVLDHAAVKWAYLGRGGLPRWRR